MSLALDPVGNSYLLVGGAALALCGLLLVAGLSGEKASRGRRRALAAMRIGVIALVTLAMLRPTLVYTKTEKQAATLILLADRSRSMSVPDEAGGATRWEALTQAIADAESSLGALAEDFEVAAYAFDASAHPIDIANGAAALGETPDGEETAIGSVLEDVLGQHAGKRLLGVVLLSDGAQRANPPRDVLPQTAASRLRPLGYPVFSVRLGKTRGLGQAQDVAVKELLANQRVFVKNELTVATQVRVDGYVNQEVQVRLLVESSAGEMKPVAEKRLKVMADGERIPVEFTHVWQLPGEYKITVETVAQPEELVKTNNRLSTFVNVQKGGLNVLYLEGFPPREEQKFLRWALDASPDINVDALHLDPRRPGVRPADLGERFKPGKYEVYMLGNLHASIFEPAECDDLAESVSQGAGLIMIGGVHSFGPGGYAKTALANVLPIRLSHLDRQGLDDQVSQDLHLPGPLRMAPTTLGIGQFSMRLRETRQESQAAWARLPPLDNANRFRADSVKRGALVLAAAGSDRPLLVAHEAGNGRVMAFAGDTTWRWWMQGHANLHKRFWRQTVLWLARKDEMAEGNVWVKLDRRRFAPQELVEFRVGAQSPEGDPVGDAQFRAEVVLPDGQTRPLRVVGEGEELVGSFHDTQAAGDYTLRVTATRDGQRLGTAKSRFLILEQDLELDNAAADATVLEGLAAMTGGESLVPEELPHLIQSLAEKTESLEVRTETQKPLWDTWPLFLLLVGLLGVEWFLRKRWGLV